MLPKLAPALFLCATLLVPASHAQDDETLAEIADRNHELINDKLQATSRWLDEYFGEDRSFEQPASTVVRLAMLTDLAESDGGNVKLRLRGKLKLPRVEDRLSLIFEGEPDENDFTGLEQESGTAELRYRLATELVKNASISLGMRGGFTSPTLYLRARSEQTRQHGRFLLRGTPTVTHDSAEGWSTYYRVDAEFTPYKRQFYRSTSTPIWSEEFDQFKLEQSFSHYYSLSEHRHLVAEWLLLFRSVPNREIESSIVQIRHRRELWRDRLYLEVAPGVRFLEENDHRLEWQAGATVEWVFRPES